MDELETLLAHGGWTLVDPAPQAAANPDTFEMPSAASLAAIAPGSVVRALFRTATIADVIRDGFAPYDEQGRPVLVAIGERMWATVIGRDGDLLECVMQNMPFGTHARLEPYDRIRIPVDHLIAIADPLPDYADFLTFLARWESDPQNPRHDPTAPVDPLAAPRLRPDQTAIVARTDAPAQPPIPFANVLMSRNVTPDSVPVYGARFEPHRERRSCGWMFFTGPPDVEQVSQQVGFDVVTLQEACRRHPRIIPYIALAPGWGFTVGPEDDDVYPVGED